MKADIAITFAALLGSGIANAVVQSGVYEATAPELGRRDDGVNQLFKRKGGGGGGGRGGGGGGSSSSGGSSRSGSSGSSSISSGGASRSFAGGRFYGGGASSPYKAGSKSPSGISPVLLVGAATLAIWPAVWLHGAYHYNYAHPYHFHNDTANEDQDLPVICGCDPYSPCGCDENEDDEYLAALIGNGDPSTFDKNIVSVANVNGTTTLLINGTLPNGTVAPDESGATNAGSGLEMLGYWPMVVTVAGAVFMF